MTQTVFCDWLLKFNRLFRRNGKKVLSLVDNCSAHKCEAIQDSLDHVNVVFLPPNTNSVIQPCDADIINAFKLNYRRLMLRKVGGLVDNPTIEKLDTKALKKNINVPHCLQYAKDAWQSVTETTVQNCWRKAGFSGEMQATEDNTVPEVQSELAQDIQELQNLTRMHPSTCRHLKTQSKLCR